MKKFERIMSVASNWLIIASLCLAMAMLMAGLIDILFYPDDPSIPWLTIPSTLWLIFVTIVNLFWEGPRKDENYEEVFLDD